MTHQIYIQCVVASGIGIAFQIVMKMISLQSRSRAANKKFSAAEYFRNDWLVIIATFITCAAFIFFLDELTSWQPFIKGWVKLMFVFVGYTGSSVLQLLLSRTAKKLEQIIDLKTNIADGIVPPVTEENKEAVPEVIKSQNENIYEN